MNFFTVSGVAATRVSPAAVSLTTAILTLADDHDDEERDDEADNGAPFEQANEPFVIADMMRDFLGWRIVQKRLLMRHVVPLDR